MRKIHVMHITYDMRIGGTEMVIKNIIDGLTQPKSDTNHHSENDTDHDSASRHSRDHFVGNSESLDPQLNHNGDENFKMSVLCIESPLGPFAEELQNNGIEFFELNRQPGFDINLIKQIRRTIKDNAVDIIHCHQYTPWVYGVIAAAFTKTKVIFTEHGRFYPDSSTWKRKLINPILNLFTDQVTAISKATKQALVEFESIPEKSIDVVYNGISPLQVIQSDVEKLRIELSIPENHIVLGTIARFDPIKNHTMMLKAFALVLEQQPKTTLIMVGDGEERKNIETCVNQLNIQNNVLLIGYQHKPHNYLALMDIYLLSSLSEGTSMTLLEAMSLSKPCVVTNAGGNPEIVTDKENGFVTTNGIASEFAAGVIQVINSLENGNGLGHASKDRFDTLFSERSMNKKYQQLYLDKLNK
ncbi:MULTISPECIES: glycosyltransferase [Colwellia]|uniref:Glycosyl transferase n=1 Tax=Colwellia marinimaniae TaxID=1513592 RepID=A0ABQ0MT39_9GAMM|nr:MULTISPECIES: glycosyltransferase [Colwellia]GAW95525.1 glycosyl transferase [Colwellia marinimaniae]